MIYRRPLPSAEYLRECLAVDLDTGALCWLKRPRHHFASDGACKCWNSQHAGKPAFTAISPRGYFHGAVDNRIYFAHRIVWKIITGDEPGEIDHIDGNPQNNAPANLRIVTRRQNARNARVRSDNKSGHAGIFWDDERQKWRAHLGGRLLGRFVSQAEAIARRRTAMAEAGYHPNHGRVAR